MAHRDGYTAFVSSGLGKKLATTLGLPQPVALRRQVRMRSAELGYYNLFGDEKLGGAGQGGGDLLGRDDDDGLPPLERARRRRSS